MPRFDWGDLFASFTWGMAIGALLMSLAACSTPTEPPTTDPRVCTAWPRGKVPCDTLPVIITPP